MIGGARGLPEREKRATHTSRFYRVTATPGPLFVKWRDSLDGPGGLRPWDGLGRAGQFFPVASCRSQVGPPFLIAPARARVLLPRGWRTGEPVPRQSDATTHLGRQTSHLGRTWPTISGGKGDKP
jgi:hypothetical protein